MHKPSDSELELLKAFWRHGDMSAAEVQTEMAASTGWAASTTRTVLERMRAKGLLNRRPVHGVAVYAAAQDKVDVLGAVLRRMGALLDMDGPLPAAAFSGSQLLTEAEVAELEARLSRPEDPAS